MITRPLDLASQLRPEPRNFNYLFLVNGGFIVLFFMLFGSRFVLAPSLGVDFKLPQMAGALQGAVQTTHVISVKSSGQIFGSDGMINLVQLKAWLQKEVKKTPHPALLVRAEAGVPAGEVVEITNMALESGFGISVAVEALPKGAESRR